MARKNWVLGVVSLVVLSAGCFVRPAVADTAATVVSNNDTDIDMTLDLAEVKTAGSAHFDKLNKDGDSTLETTEVKGVIGARMFKAADTDHDGTISKDEYLALVETLFKKADTDNDGTLSVAELKSKSAHRLKRLID
jgi:hypothetical protein